MPKITSVEPQKKNSKRFNIYLDGQFAFGADEDLVVERRLVVGKTIEQNDLEKILFEAEVGKLMERMYGWFGFRQRSEWEVRQKFKIQNSKFKILEKEQISDLVIDSLVEKLKRKGLLNDKEFAKAWVKARRAKKGWRAIQSELFQKGIDREIIESIKYQESSIMDEKAAARTLLEKKMRVWGNLPYLEKKKKMIEYLLRRGFEYEVVREVVNKLINPSTDD